MEYELYHYGVKGMKWGVRRYQNTDGTLTAEGKRKAKQEYKQDNKTAFELGRDASIAGFATGRSMKRTIKLENRLEKRYAKDPEGVKRSTKTLREKWDASAKTTTQLSKVYMDNKTKAEKHCKSLIDKYGKEAVTSIKYAKYTLPKGKYSPTSLDVVNEKVNTLSDYARAGAKSLLMTGMMQAMGIPFAALYLPRTADETARQVEYNMYRGNLEAQKKK